MSRLHRIIPPLLALPVLFSAVTAQAVPSFARQTGLACQVCHTIFPELTAFGRNFKLNGYTMTGIKQVEATASPAAAALKFDQIPPLSMMLQVSGTYSKAQAPTSQVAFPDQLSFFYAGEITPHIGSFIQLTLEGASGTFGMDNTDIRYANHAGAITYGVTLNNNPTVQDLWNSTPAWGYPWTTGAGVTEPMVASLGGAVAGLGAYADWGNGLYTELSFYKDSGAFDISHADGGAKLAGTGQTSKNANISGLAPYARVAYQTTLSNGDSLMVGGYGMEANLYQIGVLNGGADKYTDLAVDTQYEHTLANSNDMISVHGTYTHEKQDLAMSGGGSQTLKSVRLNGTYHWGYHTEATLAWAKDTGGTANAYDDNAWTAQVSYLPWQNTKFTLQYVDYTKINSTMTGTASNNDAALLQGWFMW